jgi:hypothetical protein
MITPDGNIARGMMAARLKQYRLFQLLEHVYSGSTTAGYS